MMTREELEAALDRMNGDMTFWSHVVVREAARKQLALMPEKCGTCSELEVRTAVDPYALCPTCHGSGKVYPRAVVERVLLALPFYLSEEQLVAVLDALGETE